MAGQLVLQRHLPDRVCRVLLRGVAAAPGQ